MPVFYLHTHLDLEKLEIMPGGHGGIRKGSGMPKGTVLKSTRMKEASKQVILEIFRDNQKEILAALIEAATGVKYFNEKGMECKKPPDIQAARLLMEYALGKAPQPLTNEEGEVFKIEVVRASVVREP